MNSNILSQLGDAISSAINPYRILNKFYFELGVFVGKSQRKVKLGINNAELLFIHENGSPLKNIPARPVLQMTIDHVRATLLPETINNCIQLIDKTGGNEAVIEKELHKLAIKIENYCRELIYSNDGRLAPNAPSTIARKGDNHPLFDTGQLARSITCRVVKV